MVNGEWRIVKIYKMAYQAKKGNGKIKNKKLNTIP
jgi:hypothetical protein